MVGVPYSVSITASNIYGAGVPGHSYDFFTRELGKCMGDCMELIFNN